MTAKRIIIAIDGYSSCGKSTTAKAVAGNLAYTYIDSGAMYRAVTLYFHQNNISASDHKAITKALDAINISFRYQVFVETLHATSLQTPDTTKKAASKADTYLNGLNVEEEIRKMYISEKVSEVSAITQVRKAMVAQQQQLGKKKGVVIDGRDIGTKVFPNAELKIFMQADLYVRAERMQKDYLARNQKEDFDQIVENIKNRDFLDTTRIDSPLVKANDAYLLDVTSITVEEQVGFVMKLAKEKINE
ncbi:MAG: (d)CMP kinase [Cytophagales bacterium]|nr:(d)CMP kinase [Cytophagales bacterium]